MEQHPQQTGAPHDEHAPSEGRWLYVTNRHHWDQGQRGGWWIPDTTTSTELAAILHHHDPAQRVEDLVVIDQIGIDTMTDEDHYAEVEAHS